MLRCWPYHSLRASLQAPEAQGGSAEGQMVHVHPYWLLCIRWVTEPLSEKKFLCAIDMQKGTAKFTLQMLSNEDHQQQDGEWQGLFNPPC